MTPAPISVERLRELLAKATPGPWRSHKATVLMGAPTAGGFDISNCPRPYENAALIAAAINALPALLHQLAERDAEVERLRFDADHWAELHRLRAERVESRSGKTWQELAASERVARIAAERAREEAAELFGFVLTQYGSTIDSELHTDIAAFLAASGGKVDG